MTLKASLTCALAGASTAALIASATSAGEQNYPQRPVEMVVTFGPGGGADLMGRQMARLMEEPLGVSIPVSNVAGASGNAGLTRLKTDAADGYTIGTLISLTVASWASGLGDSKPEDFQVLAVVQSSPSFLFVPASSPYQTAQELFEYAQEHPSELTVATSGYGTQDDVTLKLLAKSGIQLENVPFQSPGERYASPIGGHTAVLYEEPGDVAQFLKAEQLKPLVVFSEERHPAFPDVPTSTELGYEISGLDNFRAVAVRAGTDPAIVEKLQSAVEVSVAGEEWQKFCSETYSCIEPIAGQAAQRMVEDFLQLIKDQVTG